MAKKYDLMIAIADIPHTIFLYNPNTDAISQNAIDDFVREGFDFRGFRLAGRDSVSEVEHKRVAELVYNKNRKNDHNIIKSWLTKHWKSVALLVGWLIGLYLFFGQLPM